MVREGIKMATGTGVFMLDVIDMTLEEPDVVGTVHIVAANPEAAAKKAMNILGEQGIVSAGEGKKYHVNTVLLGPLPQESKKIIAVSGAEAQAILKSGEIVAPRR
jgi:hypothetical protein